MGSAIPAGDGLVQSKSFVLDTPTSSDVFPIFALPYGATLTKVTATIIGGTSVTFQLEKRGATGLNSSGTNMLTSSLVADQNGEITTSFASAGLTAGQIVVFVASAVSGSVGKLIIEIDYTI